MPPSNFTMAAACLIFSLFESGTFAQGIPYSWLDKREASDDIISRIKLPSGYVRDKAGLNSFADWLRHLPLKDGHPPVHLYNGRLKVNQDAHYAVLDIDTGSRDLQQCADAVIRLRAEFLYSAGQIRKISFNFTSGDKALFARWLEGYRPIVNGDKVRWKKSAAPDSSYASFRAYLEIIFNYAGSYSLQKELERVFDPMNIKPGDVFIKGGFPGHDPGHAVIVLDVATNKNSGDKIFILAQSYMPAQEIHILKNPNDGDLSPWYHVIESRPLRTPEWTFEYGQLMRFR
jgi:hypothetical protein